MGKCNVDSNHASKQTFFLGRLAKLSTGLVCSRKKCPFEGIESKLHLQMDSFKRGLQFSAPICSWMLSASPRNNQEHTLSSQWFIFRYIYACPACDIRCGADGCSLGKMTSQTKFRPLPAKLGLWTGGLPPLFCWEHLQLLPFPFPYAKMSSFSLEKGEVLVVIASRTVFTQSRGCHTSRFSRISKAELTSGEVFRKVALFPGS